MGKSIKSKGSNSQRLGNTTSGQTGGASKPGKVVGAGGKKC